MNSVIMIVYIVCILLLVLFFNLNFSIKEFSFSKSLVLSKYILPTLEDWWNCCMTTPIFDENGKLHVFMSNIPKIGSWLKNSKIEDLTADRLEGPYTFIETTFASKTKAYHNPRISEVKASYVLVYLLKSMSIPRVNQKIRLATSKSLYGPWKENLFNPILKASGGQLDEPNIIHASNPTYLVDADGRFRRYYKPISDKYAPKEYWEISMATSENIEGPYVNFLKNDSISFANEKLDIEDPYAF